MADRWELTREWAGVVFGLLGTALAIQTQCRGMRIEERQRLAEERQLRAEVDIKLNQAWDLLGGKPGTETITEYSQSRQDLELAKRLVDSALFVEPNYSKAYRVLGAYWASRGLEKKAETAFKRAIEVDPECPAAHNNLGALFAGQQRHQEAEKAFRRATEIDPDSFPAHYNLGTLLLTKQRYVEAEGAFQKATSIDPEHALAQCHLGRVLMEQGQHQDAEEIFRTALQIESEYQAVIKTNLAVTLIAQERDLEVGEYLGHSGVETLQKFKELLKARKIQIPSVECDYADSTMKYAVHMAAPPLDILTTQNQELFLLTLEKVLARREHPGSP